MWSWLILSVVFVAFVYVGYPVLLYLLAGSKKHIYPAIKYRGDVSIVLIVCNEDARVAKKIDNLLALNYEGGTKRIIVVDDASTDSTLEILKRYKDDITLVQSEKRLGKANGLNLAMKNVDTELVLMVDCRQELELDVLQHLSSWFTTSEYGAVSGELMFKSEDGNGFSQGMDGYWKYEKFIRSKEAILNSVPGVTGALYMLRTAAFKDLPIDTLLDDVQIPMLAIKQGYRVGFDDRALAWDEPSVSIEREKQRKIRTLSGNYQLLVRFPNWVLPLGHPIWWQFLSHKIARLLAPFVAIGSLLPASFLILEGQWLAVLYTILFVSALLVLPISYALPQVNKIKILKLMTSFLTLNWFCMLAFFHYFSGIRSGSWKK